LVSKNVQKNALKNAVFDIFRHSFFLLFSTFSGMIDRQILPDMFEIIASAALD